MIAPSNWAEDSWLASAKTRLEKEGYRVTIHPQCYLKSNQSAGTPEDKVNALHEVFADKSVDAIFCARGGNGAVHLLDKIDYNLIRKNPKIFLGYSDITALHVAFYEKSGLMTFHGPVFSDFGRDDYDQYSISSTLNLLSGERQESVFQDVSGADFDISGPLVVGNLSLLNALCDTPWAPPLHGAILMIEDIAEEVSHFDRIMWQWRASGRLEKIAALVVGRFTDMKDEESTQSASFGLTVPEIIENHMRGLDIPVAMGVSFGHKGRNPAVPFGVNVSLTLEKSSLLIKYKQKILDFD